MDSLCKLNVSWKIQKIREHHSSFCPIVSEFSQINFRLYGSTNFSTSPPGARNSSRRYWMNRGWMANGGDLSLPKVHWTDKIIAWNITQNILGCLELVSGASKIQNLISRYTPMAKILCSRVYVPTRPPKSVGLATLLISNKSNLIFQPCPL